MKTMSLFAALAAIAVAGGAGFAVGYDVGIGKGAEVSAELHATNDAHQAFRQASAALIDLEAADPARSNGARAQLSMALQTLGEIAASGGPDTPCTPANRETLQAVSRHLQAHPFPDGSPVAQLVPGALKYCG